MAWYLAPALDVLRAEVNTRWPRRDKGSDGTIGDLAHQESVSDHNVNSRESVDAWDMDKDGVDVNEVIAAFQKHPSAHYWIWQRQIADRDNGWARRPYSGSNRHDQHAHFSIRQTRAAEQDTRPWGLLPQEEDMTPAEFAAILDDPAVKAKMRALPWQYQDPGQPSAHGIVLAQAGALRPLADRIAEQKLLSQAILEAVQGDADTAAILARIDQRAAELAAAQQELAAAEIQRDAELRALVEQHAAGTLDAEDVVQRMGELLAGPQG